MEIKNISADALPDYFSSLCTLLRNCVEAGASIGFLTPLTDVELQTFWHGVAQGLAQHQRRLFVAVTDGEVTGTVQLVLDMPANGRHRAEIVKLMVAPHARRMGIGRALMQLAMQAAKDERRSLLVLDTRSGDAAEPLYLSLGFNVAGRIPGYARSTEGNLDATTIMFKQLNL